MIVLDASAILALLHDEPGAAEVAQHLPEAILSSANLAEVIDKLVDVSAPIRAVHELLVAAGRTVEPLTEDDAILAGALRSVSGGMALSLGDRCCIALGVRHQATVLTADRSWAALTLPVTVQLIR